MKDFLGNFPVFSYNTNIYISIVLIISNMYKE